MATKLLAFDKLREMINAPAESEGADMTDLVDPATSYLAPDQKPSLTSIASLRSENAQWGQNHACPKQRPRKS